MTKRLTPQEVWQQACDDGSTSDTNEKTASEVLVKSPIKSSPDHNEGHDSHNEGHVEEPDMFDGGISCELLIVNSPSGPHNPRQNAAPKTYDPREAVLLVTNCTTSLEEIWNEMGTEAPRRTETLSTLWSNMSSLLSSTVKEEEKKLSVLRETVDETLRACRELEAALKWPELIEASQGSLSVQLSSAKQHLSSLSTAHEARLAAFSLLHDLNEDLGGKQGNLPIPSQVSLIADVSLDNLEECVNVMNLVSQDREATLNNLLILENERLDVLWDKLMIPTKDRNAFSTFLNGLTHPDREVSDSGIKTVTVDRLMDWVDQHKGKEVEKGVLAAAFCGCADLQEALTLTQQQVEKAKLQYETQLSLQVTETKELLMDLWEQYFTLTKDNTYSRDVILRERPIPNDATESNLTLIEGEVLGMEQKLESVKSVLTALTRRDELLKEKEAMELASKDKDRLTDRSRNMAQVLLQEERTRKALKKELPKIEKFLKSYCDTYSRDNKGLPFIYKGLPLVDQLGSNDVGHHSPSRRDRQQQQQQPEQRASRARSPAVARKRAVGAASPAPTSRRVSIPPATRRAG
eukprot:TRINITY_DN11519_c1_g1_i1.p1 TRINITY_DN11519_c1_g1~~TRINITY_DN11519_c1_g1_i1.p1  ORF type:complete len:577 (+),score=113.16 TRINITY_DN11519_c1_g1_i1:63-1793(+)